MKETRETILLSMRNNLLTHAHWLPADRVDRRQWQSFLFVYVNGVFRLSDEEHTQRVTMTHLFCHTNRSRKTLLESILQCFWLENLVE